MLEINKNAGEINAIYIFYETKNAHSQYSPHVALIFASTQSQRRQYSRIPEFASVYKSTKYFKSLDERPPNISEEFAGYNTFVNTLEADAAAENMFS